MIEYHARTIKKEKLKKLNKYSKDSWINVIDPDEKEIELLVEDFKLNKALVIDGLDIHEIPRIEEEGEKIYVFLSIPTLKIPNEYTCSFLIIISRNLFITISKTDLDFLDIITNAGDFLTNQKTKGLLQILFLLSNKTSHEIRKILKQVRINRSNIKKLTEKDIFNLVIWEDELNDYLSDFNSIIDIHKKLLKLKSLKFREDEKEFIEDLTIDLYQTLNSGSSSIKSISNMRDYYSTTISNKLNKILTTLTIFTVLLTIPTIISGIYGMNISLPGQNSSMIFLKLIGIVVLIWGVIITFFKKFKFF